MDDISNLINFLTDLKDDILHIDDSQDINLISIKNQLIDDVDCIMDKCFTNDIDEVIEAYMDRWNGPCIVRELDIDIKIKMLIIADWKIIGMYLLRYLKNK